MSSSRAWRWRGREQDALLAQEPEPNIEEQIAEAIEGLWISHIMSLFVWVDPISLERSGVQGRVTHLLTTSVGLV